MGYTFSSVCNDLRVDFSNFPVSSELDNFLHVEGEGILAEKMLKTSVSALFSAQKTWVGTIYLIIFFDFFHFQLVFFDFVLDTVLRSEIGRKRKV